MEYLALEARKYDRTLQLAEVVEETDRKLGNRIDAFGEFVVRFGEKLDKDREERKARDDRDHEEWIARRDRDREERKARNDEYYRKLAEDRKEYDRRMAFDREEYDRKYIYGGGRNLAITFENLVTAVLREWLYKQGYRDFCELPSGMRKFPTTSFSNGPEWDGVICCVHKETEKWHQFLVEAKTNMSLTSITTKSAAVEITREFIAQAHNGEIQRNTRNNTSVMQVAGCWAVYHDMEIHVVLGAHAFDSAMVQEIERRGHIRVCLNADLYHVTGQDGQQVDLTFEDIEHYFELS